MAPLLAHPRFALPAAMACKGWFGTPWWPEVVEEFMKGLDEPDSPAWKHDDRSKPERPVVADRAVLRQTLLSAPEELDGDTAWWCLAHGLGHWATHRAYVRRRKQREAEWDDPARCLLDSRASWRRIAVRWRAPACASARPNAAAEPATTHGDASWSLQRSRVRTALRGHIHIAEDCDELPDDIAEAFAHE